MSTSVESVSACVWAIAIRLDLLSPTYDNSESFAWMAHQMKFTESSTDIRKVSNVMGDSIALIASSLEALFSVVTESKIAIWSPGPESCWFSFARTNNEHIFHYIAMTYALRTGGTSADGRFGFKTLDIRRGFDVGCFYDINGWSDVTLRKKPLIPLKIMLVSWSNVKMTTGLQHKFVTYQWYS